MKTYKFFYLSLLISALSSSAFAQSSKVAVIDIQKVIASSDQGKNAKSDFEGSLKKAQTEIDSKKLEYQELRKKYEIQKDTLTGKAKQEKEDTLIAKEKELKKLFKESEDSLRARESEVINSLIEKVKKIVAQLAKDKGYDIVIEQSQGVLYSTDSINITDKVIEKIND